MRRTFLGHFVICLAAGAGAFFAWRAGVFAAIWGADESRMTSAIAALLVVSAVELGRQAWRADNPGVVSPVSGKTWDAKQERWREPARPEFGHLAMLMAPALGMLGTVIGLSLQAEALVGGAAAFGPLATGLYSTGCGIAAFVLIAVMTFNLESAARRGGRNA